VTYLENAADEWEKEDCSRYTCSSLYDRVRSTAIVQARTSMNVRQSNTQVLTLMHTIKHTHRVIEISRWFLALEYCEIEAVHKHIGIHRACYKDVGQMQAYS